MIPWKLDQWAEPDLNTPRILREARGVHFHAAQAEGLDPTERAKRERSDFLAEKDSEGGVFDFHALRATFVTNLARSGVSLFHASKLARHTDPQLTAKVYAKLGISDEREALAKLPSLTDDPDPAAIRATGTDGGPSDTPAILICPAKGPDLSTTGRESSGSDDAHDERKPLRFQGMGAAGPNCPQAAESHLGDLNPGPMLYESIALPTELWWPVRDPQSGSSANRGF